VNAASDDSAFGLELELHEELALGVFKTPGSSATFLSDQLEIEAGLTEALSLRVSGGVTHFFATSQLQALSVLSLAVGARWLASPRLELGLNLHGSPTLVWRDRSTDPADPGTFDSRSGVLGGDTSAEYSGPRGAAFAWQVGITLGVTRYAMQERFLESGGSGEADWEFNARLWQACASVAGSVSIRERTELTLAGSYYAYYGAPNSEVTAVLVGGVPFEPVRYALRPTLAQRIGALQIALHGQYAGYATALGHSWNAGLEVHWTLTDVLAISTAAELTQASYSDAGGFGLYQMSLAIELVL